MMYNCHGLTEIGKSRLSRLVVMAVRGATGYQPPPPKFQEGAYHRRQQPEKSLCLRRENRELPVDLLRHISSSNRNLSWQWQGILMISWLSGFRASGTLPECPIDGFKSLSDPQLRTLHLVLDKFVPLFYQFSSPVLILFFSAKILCFLNFRSRC